MHWSHSSVCRIICPAPWCKSQIYREGNLLEDPLFTQVKELLCNCCIPSFGSLKCIFHLGYQVHTHMISMSSWLSEPLLIKKCPSLSLKMFLNLKTILSNINIASADFFMLIVYGVFIPTVLFSIYLFLQSKSLTDKCRLLSFSFI